MNSPWEQCLKIAATSDPGLARALLAETKIPPDWLERLARAVHFHETAGALIVGDLSPTQELEYSDELLEMVRTKDSDGLRKLADYLDTINAGKSGIEHFAGALIIKDYFTSTQGREPSKSELKKAMELAGAPRPQPGDNKGWARVFRDAGLTELPKKKAKRGKTRNGG